MLVVPRTPTPLAFYAIPALIDAAFRAKGKVLSPVQRANLATLVAIETARGSAVQNYNIGNITAAESYHGSAWRPPWFDVDASSSERMLALHASMIAGKAPRAFRAYESHEQGALDFASLLLASGYASLMRGAESSDPDVFRRALAERYSKDYSNPKATAALRQLQQEFGMQSVSVSVPPLFAMLAIAWLFRK